MDGSLQLALSLVVQARRAQLVRDAAGIAALKDGMVPSERACRAIRAIAHTHGFAVCWVNVSGMVVWYIRRKNDFSVRRLGSSADLVAFLVGVGAMPLPVAPTNGA